jgi:hypothetical protein
MTDNRFRAMGRASNPFNFTYDLMPVEMALPITPMSLYILAPPLTWQKVFTPPLHHPSASPPPPTVLKLVGFIPGPPPLHGL